MERIPAAVDRAEGERFRRRAERDAATFPIADSEVRGRWRMLALLAAAELLGMSLWFTASAVAPQLRVQWGLSAQQAGWLTTVVQLGFVGGTALAAFLNLADLVDSRRYFTASALAAAAANGALALGPAYPAALVARFLTGFFLAGVYPPAMKMAATWFRASRGLAIGTIVGALTVGKATPYLVHALEGASLSGVVLTASAGAVLAALFVAFGYSDGPYPFAQRPFSWRLVGRVLGDRETAATIAAYLGHMWELYAMWALVPLFYYETFLARGASEVAATTWSGVLGFAVIGMGGAGAVVAGAWADRWGRERVAMAALAVSGSCALVTGWLGAAPYALLAVLGLVWGFAVVADSAQFSAITTEVAPAHAVGTALTIQTSLGFALTAGSIWLTIAISARFGWGPAFSLLAVGPAWGIPALRRLKNMRVEDAPEVVERGA